MLDKHAGIMTKVVGAYTRNVEKHTPIHPEYAAVQLDETAADDAVFTVDTGMNNVWAARYLTPNGKRRVIGSFIHGSMANALPHATGSNGSNADHCSSGRPPRATTLNQGKPGITEVLKPALEAAVVGARGRVVREARTTSCGFVRPRGDAYYLGRGGTASRTEDG